MVSVRVKIISLLVRGSILLVFLGSGTINPSGIPDFNMINQLYQSGRYQAVIDSFYQVLKKQPGLLQKEPVLRFKIGYSYFQLGNYNQALKVFENSLPDLKIIEDYVLYFQAFSYLHLKDTLLFESFTKTLRWQYPTSPLIPLVDSINAGIAVIKQQSDTAIHYLQASLKSGYFDRDGIYLDLLKMYLLKRDTIEYRKLAFQFLNTYPFHDQSLSVYQELRYTYDQKIPIEDLKKLLNYLFRTSKILTAELLLEQQQPFAKEWQEKEFFRWMPQQILFHKGEFDKLLKWSLMNRSRFKISPILREIDLHIARCYLRLNNTTKSIEYYLKFQESYPRDPLSAEVLWKVAWLYEEKGDISSAIQMYRKLVNIYPRYEFYSEAYFRIGLNYYRLKKYQSALRAWKEALQKVSQRSQKDRISYWIGKGYEMQKDYKKQGEIYIQLAQRPIDTFYNLKAFYLTSDGRDFHQKINEIFWRLHEDQQSFIGNYIDKFKRALMIEDILGPRWGDRELRTFTENSNEWPEKFSLGELYEKMGNYGFAFRHFRQIYDRYFTQAEISEIAPIFKKLYPLYYANQVDSASHKFEIPAELIWSVIKKESAFEAKAISYANAYGLMQLLPGTASQVAPYLGIKYFSTKQLFDPAINIRLGAFYLSSLLKRYEGNYVKALAAYNAGPHRVDRWKKIYDTADDDLFMENLEFEQTREYVRTCLKYFWLYRTIINPGEIPPEIVNYPIKLTDYL